MLENKVILHVPIVYYEDGKYYPVGDEVREALVNDLADANIITFFVEKVEGYYQKRRYPEELWFIYSDPKTYLLSPETVFKKWVNDHREQLKQSEYVYEEEGGLHLFK